MTISDKDTSATQAVVGTPSVARGPDAPLPPIDEPDLLVLMAAYSTNELRVLAQLAKLSDGTPPAVAQDVIRMVRRREDTKAITQFIRDRVPGIAAKTAMYEWAMRELQGAAFVSPRPPLQGGGKPLVIGIEGDVMPRDDAGDLIQTHR